MEGVLQGVLNFIKFISEYWVFLVAIVIAVITAYVKVSSKIKAIVQVFKDEELTFEEKLDAIWIQVEAEILALCANSELEWKEFEKAGAIKRSEVLSQIYAAHPELSILLTKEEVEAWVDKLIDEALDQIREVIRPTTLELNDKEAEVEIIND